MRFFTYTIEIARAPERVWAYMMNFDNAPRWRSLVRRIDVLTPAPVGVGSQLKVTFDARGTVRALTTEVWAFDHARRFGLRNTEQGITGTFLYVLEPAGAGTRVTFSCDVRPHGLRWLLMPFLIRGNRQRYSEQLPRLKAEVERDTMNGWNTSASARPA
jgi:hypothetical protein